MQDPTDSHTKPFEDRFVLREALHTGANTEVWLADDTRSGISVALKLLDRSAAERGNYRAAFEREWQIARALNHPHTVRALSYHDGVRPAYAMQYIDGTDFSELAGRGFDIYAPPVLVIIDTLLYWHRKGVLHGDLKPSNLLLDRQGVAYLADFGAALIVDDPAAPGLQERGSPAYSSPEYRAGDTPEFADDIYAIAAVVGELADGDPRSGQFAGVPISLAGVLKRCLRSRSKRPSLQALRDAFAEAGVLRGSVDLQALDIVLRRPAAQAAAERSPIPVLPHGAFEPISARETPASGVSLRQLLIGLVVILLFGVLFTLLLQWLTRPSESVLEPAAVAEPAAAPKASPQDPPATAPDQRLEDRAGSEAALGELLSIIDVLEQRAVGRWAGDAFREGRQRYERGDRAYLAGDYSEARRLYDEALGLLRPLTAQVLVAFEQALRDGDAALLAADAESATRAYELALAITPGDDLARRGVERAAALNQVLEQMALGELDERAGDLDEALQHYEQAQQLDALWRPAAESVQRVRGLLDDRAFKAAMSAGFTALDEQRFAAARSAFAQARVLRPNSAALADALLQLRIADRQQRIDDLLTDARRAEQAEDWLLAAQHYESLLALDASLDVARQGLQRVRQRETLELRAQSIIDNPDLLAELQTLRDSSALLSQLKRLQPRGAGLAATIASLEQAISAAAVPRAVTLRSDGETTVAVLRVEQLGRFEQTELRLRPGAYTAVGSRRGYVDVRVDFRVPSDGAVPAVVVICETTI